MEFNKKTHKILILLTLKVSIMKKINNILELFFNEPARHWHFKEITDKARISDQRCNVWLKRLIKEKIITYHKTKGRRPYYRADDENTDFQNKKRLFGLNRLLETGFLRELQSIKKTVAIIIFGSYARGDWNSESDLDVFIYGDPAEFKYGGIWDNREVNVIYCKTKNQIKNIRSGLINNVLKGFFIKGNIHDLIGRSI